MPIKITCSACASLVDFEYLGIHFKKFCQSPDKRKEEMMAKYNKAYLLKADHRNGNLTDEEFETEVKKYFE